MKSIFLHVKWFLYNIITIIIGVFIRRDKCIWLFGAWMGERYADNPRALYQYLHFNKEQYNIKKVIWITDSIDIQKELCNAGFECYIRKSFKGIYYHFKAGIHVICNMYDNINGYRGDILGRLSYGAVKVQLWHGVGIKAVSNMRNSYSRRKSSYIKNFLRKFFDKGIFSPGGWNTCFWLACGTENRRVLRLDHGIDDEKRVINSTYPRFLESLYVLDTELVMLSKIEEERKKGKKIIAYIPTFRNDYSQYIYPTDIEGFQLFIEKNNIVWMEKRHLVAHEQRNEVVCSNMLHLPSEFDINIILNQIDLLISDYSSVITDAVKWNIKTLNYIPDFVKYRDEDRGFVADYDLYNPGWKVYDSGKLLETISRALENDYFDKKTEDYYKKTYEELIGVENFSYESLMNSIFNKIKENN